MANAKKASGLKVKTSSTTQIQKNDAKKGIKEEVLSVVLFILSVFLFICINNFQGTPDDAQFIGLVGTWLMKGVRIVFGTAGLIASFYILVWSIHLGVLKRIWSIRMWGVTLLTLTVLISKSVYEIPKGLNAWEAGIKGMGGGYIGGGLAYLLNQLVGGFGISIFLFLFVILSLIMILEKPVSEIATVLWNTGRRFWEKLSQIMYYEEENVPGPRQKSEEVIINPDPEIVPEILTSPVAKKIELITLRDSAVVEEPIVSQKHSMESNKGKVKSYEYIKPPIEMLGNLGSERSIDKKNIKESISVLEDTFASFGIGVKVNQVSCGPAVTRYELTPAPGVKVSKIISLTDDLQLNLAAPGIRIEAPIPGKSAIGIEVPNSKVTSVGLRNLITSSSFNKLNSPLAFVLGEDISGNSIVAKLSDMPHLLIAGSTGSGKSVCLNSIIMSLLYNSTPDELKLVFIDPKMVELTIYNGIPHLLTPVVTDSKKASVVLRWMTTEMEKRYKMFADKGVRDIYRYNQTVSESLPFIVIVIDELADLMMVAPVEVEDSICRLAQMARAAGIHLIVATQRPSVDVVTGIIKANIPSRIAFAVSSQADSRTILDIGGAEKLLGKGDMLFFPVGAVKPYRVQGAFVSDSDIERTVNYIKDQEPKNQMEDPTKNIEIALEQMEFDYGDEMFWDAVRVFVESKKASVSLLQRKLRIGYARAARLVDLMEDRGIVSESDSNKKREILIDDEQLEKLYANSKLC